MTATTRRPRVLHLAYEDPRAPGSGGGSVRTREVNDRLTADFDITVVSAAYRGAERYERSGVVYDVLGSRRGGRFAGQLSYFAALPAYVRRHGRDYDLVVEDFGAPVSSVGVPRFTDTPVLGVVQWLFAAEKSRQYHLPFARVERHGLRAHRRIVTVSSGMAEDIAAREPGIRVDVVENGLPADTWARPLATGPRRDILFLGRLDVEHKGLDLLLDAFASVLDRTTDDLHVAGDGAGEAWLREQIEQRGLGGRVELLGRVDHEVRLDLLERYRLVAMPSRYESFGMVAAEAAAVGTPVAAFDIACLRDLVDASSRVPAFDVAAYADLLVDVAAGRGDVPDAAGLRRSVEHLTWDVLADRQKDVYLDMIESSTPAPAPVAPSRPVLTPLEVAPGAPRVAVLGGSTIHGLGYSGVPFGRLAGQAWGAEVVDLSAISRTCRQILDGHLDEVRALRPDVTVLMVGGTESLIRPDPRIEDLIQRFAPATWHGVAGLEPRARFSRSRARRVRQRLESTAKVALKHLLFRVFGGGRPKVDPDVLAADFAELLAEVAAVSGHVVVVGLPDVDPTLFPGTAGSFARTNAMVETSVARCPTAEFVALSGRLHRWDDYLADHLHLDGPGHERAAGLLGERLAALPRDGEAAEGRQITRRSSVEAEA